MLTSAVAVSEVPRTLVGARWSGRRALRSRRSERERREARLYHARRRANSVVRGSPEEISEELHEPGLRRTVNGSRENEGMMGEAVDSRDTATPIPLNVEQDISREEPEIPEPPATIHSNTINEGALFPVPLHWGPMMRRSPRPYASSSRQGHPSPCNEIVPEPRIVEITEDPDVQPERGSMLFEIAPPATQEQGPEPQSTLEEIAPFNLRSRSEFRGNDNDIGDTVAPSTFVSSLHVSDSARDGGTSCEQRSPFGNDDAQRRKGIAGTVGSAKDSGAGAMVKGSESDCISSLNWDR